MSPARALRSDKHTYDGHQRWRGAMLWNLGPTECVLRILRVGSDLVGDRTVGTVLIPESARSLGCPLAVRLEGAGDDVVEVVGSVHSAGDATSNNAQAVAENRFRAGVIPRSVTGESRFYDGED